MFLVISSYDLIQESVESNFKITFDLFKDSNIYYTLKFPSNPILDCQIINLDEQPINNVLIKLNSLIDEDEFGLTSRIQLIQFKNWISKIVSLLATQQLNLN